jgi:predicted transposase YdaD
MKANIPESPTEKPRKKNDLLLKAAFEECFHDLLRFFYTDADQIFDMNRNFEFMDKELREIYPERSSKGGTRIADLLVKIFLLNGKEKWFLVHLEIQAQNTKAFSFRMFQYHYRLLDRFGVQVVSLVVFTGRKSQQQPGEFKMGSLGTEIIYRYKTYQIFDHTELQLLNMDNPFALIVIAAQKALRENKIPEEELNKERTIIAKAILANKTYDHKKIRKLIIFLKNFLYVENKNINRNFDIVITELTKEKINMGIEETVIMLAREEGIEEGIEQGIELGIERGIEKGFEKGANEKALAIAKQLKQLDLPISLILKATKLSLEEVTAL